MASLALSLEPLPIRALHLLSPSPADVPALVAFIRDDAPKAGLNTLVVEVGYGYQFQSRPEMKDPGGLDATHLKSIAEACRASNIRFIPGINLLGHQSWAKENGGLLKAHPEFDETPGKYKDNEGIYCRSYCPNHPELHKVLFALIDELLDASGADAFHGGMDEVFLLGDKDCPRCGGKDPADLFADEVKRLHAHLKSRGKELWIWGDRLIDGQATGIGEWEAATNGTHPAIDRIPKDVVICDWHYERAHPTAGYFALKGFRVISCPWRKTDVALAQLEQIRLLRRDAAPEVGKRLLGMMQTTWGTPAGFLKGWSGASDATPASKEVVATLRALMEKLMTSGS